MANRTATRASRSRPTAERARSIDAAPLGASGKALMILELVSAAHEPLSMAELVRRSGLTKPTAHRITAALAEMGLIERDHWKRGYIEGPRLIKLALDTLAAARASRAPPLDPAGAVAGSRRDLQSLSFFPGSEVV